MTIIQDHGITTLSGYLALKKEVQDAGRLAECQSSKTNNLLVPDRPAACPECNAPGSFWVHGYFYRWAIEGELETVVPIPRYRCQLCRLIVSVLFAFLVPYRQFTVQAMAEAVKMYVSTETSYRTVAGELSCERDDSQRPNHSAVWHWVRLFAHESAASLAIVLQRACMRAGREKHLMGVSDHVCPNAYKAHSLAKTMQLNFAIRVLALANVLLDWTGNLVHGLQTYFAGVVQNPSSILTGRGISLITPQSSQQVIL